jgi:serine protease inhibitor
MVSSIRSGQKNYTLEMADKVYVQDGFPVLDAYKSTIEQYYAGQFESVKFSEKEKTAKVSNFKFFKFGLVFFCSEY